MDHIDHPSPPPSRLVDLNAYRPPHVANSLVLNHLAVQFRDLSAKAREVGDRIRGPAPIAALPATSEATHRADAPSRVRRALDDKKTAELREKARHALRSELPELAAELEKIATTLRSAGAALDNADMQAVHSAEAAVRGMLNYSFGDFESREFAGSEAEDALQTVACELAFVNGSTVVDEVGDFVDGAS